MKVILRSLLVTFCVIVLLKLFSCDIDTSYLDSHRTGSHTVQTPHSTVPSQPTPSQPVPTHPTPTQPAPTQPTPTQPTPTQPAPTQPDPSQPDSEVNLFEGYDIPMHRTMYTKLNDAEKHIYMQLRSCVINDTYTCTLPQVNYSQYIPVLERATYALYADFPEFFWISYSVQYTYTENVAVGDLVLSLWCNAYWNDVENRREHIEAVMDQAIEISQDTLQKNHTDFDRLRYIHDYLTTNVTYDHGAAAMLGRPDQSTEDMQAHSAYGALVRGWAVCEGYAKAYKLIANLCGYDCEYIPGDAGGPHAWNYITLNGKNYWMDVTWDDPDIDNQPATRFYTYFGINSQRFFLTHTPSTEFFDLPECTDTTYDFFFYTGSHFYRYDFSAVNAAASKQAAYGMCVNLRFDSYEEMQAAINDLFLQNYRHQQLQLQGKKVVRYYTNDKFNVLMLVLEF